MASAFKVHFKGVRQDWGTPIMVGNDEDHIVAILCEVKGYNETAMRSVIDHIEPLNVAAARRFRVEFRDGMKGTTWAADREEAKRNVCLANDRPLSEVEHVDELAQTADSGPMSDPNGGLRYFKYCTRNQRQDIAARLRKFADGIEQGQCNARLYERGRSYFDGKDEQGMPQEHGAHAMILTIEALGSDLSIDPVRCKAALDVMIEDPTPDEEPGESIQKAGRRDESGVGDEDAAQDENPVSEGREAPARQASAESDTDA